MLRQTSAILLVNLRSIPARMGSSIIIVVGIGSVVAVLISLMSMARGFEATLKATGAADRALVLRAGSTSEINGSMEIEQYRIIRDLPGVAQMDGKKLASMETFVTVNVPQRKDQTDASVPMRGIAPESFLVRPKVKLLSGRNLEFGKYEMVAGISAANQFAGIDLNEVVNIRGVDWLVVGTFSASGGAYDSEMWVDERLLAATWNRGSTFSSMLVQLTGPERFESFKELIAADKRLTAHAIRESAFYAGQSKNTTNLITGVSILVGAIMAIGAIFAAINSMHAALSNRASEIATLRALGFGQLPIVVSVLIESVLIGAIGAVIGGLLVFVLLNDVGISTVAATSATFTQVAFQFMVTPQLLAWGVVLAILLALIGALFPAIKAARAPITKGLTLAT